jgi:hypothetical protein
MKNCLLKAILFFILCLLAKSSLCTPDSLIVNQHLASGHNHYSICTDSLIECDYFFTGSPGQISIPHTGCILDSIHQTDTIFTFLFSTPDSLFDIYTTSASGTHVKFFVDLASISCNWFFGQNHDAIIKASDGTDSVSYIVNLNKPAIIFHPLNSAVDCIKGHQYERSYELIAFANADYDSFSDTTWAEPEILVRDVVIKFFDPDSVQVSDSVIHQIKTIYCSDLPADSQATENYLLLLNAPVQKFTLLFEKNPIDTNTISLPDSFGQNWKVIIKEQFTCISNSHFPGDPVTGYTIASNLCFGGVNACNIAADQCSHSVSDTMNVTCASLNTEILSYVGDPLIGHDTIDLYSSVNNHLYYGYHIQNYGNSFSNTKAARRFYGMKFLVDSNYFSIADTGRITVKTKDASGNYYTLNPQPEKTIIHSFPYDTISICFKKLVGTDPDGNGPFTNAFPDPADTTASHQYYCDLPGGNDLIIEIDTIIFCASDSLLHDCTFHPLSFFRSPVDIIEMSQVDLCLDPMRQFHYDGVSCLSFIYPLDYSEGAISGDHSPYVEAFAGNASSFSSNTDLTVAPFPGTNQSDSVKLTYSFHQTVGISPWELSALSCPPWLNSNCTQRHGLATRHGVTYYAHVSIPPGYKIVPDNGHTYTAVKFGDVDSVFAYDTVLVTDPSTCKEYDLVLPGPSSSISLYVKLVTCSPLNTPACLSQNHPSAFNLDGSVSFGTTDFNMEFRAQLNDATHDQDTVHVDPTLKYIIYQCENIPMFLHCMGDCNGTFAGINDFTFERNTFGWQSGAAFLAGDTTFSTSQSAVGIHRAYINDDILITSIGGISTPIPACYTNLNFEISYPSPDTLNPLFVFDSCHITFIEMAGADSGAAHVFNLSNIPHTENLDSLGNMVQNIIMNMDSLVVGSGTIRTLLDSNITLRVLLIGHCHVGCLTFLDPGHYMLHRVAAQFTVSGISCTALGSCDPWGAAMDVLVIRNSVSHHYFTSGQGYGYFDRVELGVISEGGYPFETDFPGEYRPFIKYPSDFNFDLSSSLFFSRGLLHIADAFGSNISYQLYNILGDCSDTLNPAGGGHCPGTVQGGPFNPGGTINFHLDTLIHKFSVNGDTTSSLQISTEIFKLQPKDIHYYFDFDVNKTCLHVPDSIDWVRNFNFPFLSFSSYNKLHHLLPDTIALSCSAPDLYPVLDTLLNYQFTGSDFNFLNGQDTIIPLSLNGNNQYLTSGDTLIFCASFQSYSTGKAGWIYSPDPNVEIISIEELGTSCGANNGVMGMNDAHNLFFFNCGTTENIKFKIKFNCTINFDGSYAATPINLLYGEFPNRCLLRTLNPDSSSDLSLLASCGIYKSITINALPASFIFTYDAQAVTSTVNFCNSAAININYQLGSGQIYNAQLQIINSDFDAAQAQFALAEGTDTITGSFNGDTLIFPISITDQNEHLLTFSYFPGCSAFGNVNGEYLHFIMQGTNACGDPVFSGNKDSTVHVLFQQFIGSDTPLVSLAVSHSSTVNCGDSVLCKISVHYNHLYADSVHIIACPTALTGGCFNWIFHTSSSDSTIVTFYVNTQSSVCTGSYSMPVTVGLLKPCSPSHNCPVGEVHTVQDTIHVNCISCCTTYSNTLTQNDFNSEANIITGNWNLNSSVTIPAGHEVYIEYADIALAAGVSITTDSGGALFILNSHLHACSDMWTGIIAKGRLTVDSSSFEDAVTAIYILNNEDGITIRNSNFNANNTAISINNRHSNIQHLYGNTIHGGMLQHNPYPEQRAGYGIKFNNVSYLNIGDTIHTGNAIDSVLWGVYATNSNFKIVHANFTNITSGPSEAYPLWKGGFGIYAQGNNTDTFHVTVGGSDSETCTFQNCSFGVFARSNVGLSVTHNLFDNSSYNGFTAYNSLGGYPIGPTGVYGWISNSVDMIASYNEFRNFKQGIVMTEVFGTPYKIILTANTFNPFNAPLSVVNDDAIQVRYTSVGAINPPQVLINQNEIYKYRRGILCTKLDAQTQITDNMIQAVASNLPPYMTYGIKTQSCNGNLIDNNTFYRNGDNPVSASLNLLSGISVESGTNNIISNNWCHKAGKGIRFFNSTTNNSVHCNTLGFNYDGIRMDGTNSLNSDIGDQGSSGAAQDNFWYSLSDPNASNIHFFPAPNAQRTWYIRTTYSGTGYDPTSGECSNCISPAPAILPDFSAVANDSCASVPCDAPNPNDCAQQRIHHLIDDAGMYFNLNEESYYDIVRYVFSELEKHPELLDLGTVYDEDLQAFYDSVSATNIGILNNVTELIVANDTVQAVMINTTITPENLNEENTRLVNVIYLKTWAQNKFGFEEEDYNTLLNIAYQNPVSGGMAVYDARVMLGIDAEDYSWDAERKVNFKKPDDPRFGKISPNPNNGTMQFVYKLEEDEKGILQIFDVKGHELKFYTLEQKQTLQDIDMNGAAQGIYFYRFTVNGKIVLSNRIIISR